MENNNFFKFWYDGFEKGLMKIDEYNRGILLTECGKACSKSYTKKVYAEEYDSAENLQEFLTGLTKRFPELKCEILMGQNKIIFTYTRCACDLVTGGFVKSGLLCECSRLSLQDNWEAIMGDGKVKVSIIQSILMGQDSCKFEIELLNL